MGTADEEETSSEDEETGRNDDEDGEDEDDEPRDEEDATDVDPDDVNEEEDEDACDEGGANEDDADVDATCVVDVDEGASVVQRPSTQDASAGQGARIPQRQSPLGPQVSAEGPHATHAPPPNPQASAD